MPRAHALCYRAGIQIVKIEMRLLGRGQRHSCSIRYLDRSTATPPFFSPKKGRQRLDPAFSVTPSFPFALEFLRKRRPQFHVLASSLILPASPLIRIVRPLKHAFNASTEWR